MAKNFLFRMLLLLGLMLVLAGSERSMAAEGDTDQLAAAEAAVKAALEAEKASDTEWNSREMARSATREISRSERERAEKALRDFNEAQQLVCDKEKSAADSQQAVQQAQDSAKKQQLAEAASQAEAVLAEARTRFEERWQTLRAVSERLMVDSRAGDQAAQELLVSENDVRDRMAATRKAERAVLELKARAAEAACGAASRQAESALAKAQAAMSDPAASTAAAEEALQAVRARAAAQKELETLQRAIHEIDALTTWEDQLWDGVQVDTLRQIVEMNDHAAQIATKICAVETDADRKAALEKFGEEQRAGKVAAEQSIGQKQEIIAAVGVKIYPLRAAAMAGLKPLAPEAWDYGKARHLLVRAGFGGTTQEVEKLCGMGLYKAVDYLVDFHHRPAAAADLDAAPPLPIDPLEEKLRNTFIRNQAAQARRSVDGSQLGRLRQWWLRRMVESPRPLQEKLTLFWHGHFATQQSVVQNSYTLFLQNQLFREHAASNFGGLLYGIVHDPVMIRYLDNNLNVKGHANENLAREIMELFAMGEDQGYSEADIREAARALTGYTYDDHTGQFRFVHEQHDATEKTVFGCKGNFTGDDLVRLILDQPATARYIGGKLFEYFAYKNPSPETVDRLAGVLRANQYELTPMLKNLFLSEEFYSDRAMGTQIKSPVQLVVGLLRDVGVEHVTDYGSLDSAIQQMGLELFEPPDVKGWRYGRSWISANRLFIRYNAAAHLVKAVPQADNRSGVDLAGMLMGNGCKTAEDVVDHFAKAFFSKPLNPQQREKLVEFLGQLPPAEEWNGNREQINQRLQALLVLMLSTPEYQMT